MFFSDWFIFTNKFNCRCSDRRKSVSTYAETKHLSVLSQLNNASIIADLSSYFSFGINF